MKLIIRLKTGFFEKTPYRLVFEKDTLGLVPVGDSSAEPIVLDKKDIISVTLTEGGSTKLELQTRGGAYSGSLEGSDLMDAVVKHFKANLNVNITCEYKGGEKNA